MTQAVNFQQSGRPRLTLKILAYALFDVAGMICLATGALWLIRGQTLFVAGFPTSTSEALVCFVVGLALMLWAAAQILRELINNAASKVRQDD